MNPPEMTEEERRSRIVSGLDSYAGAFNQKGKPKMRPLRAHLVRREEPRATAGVSVASLITRPSPSRSVRRNEFLEDD